MAPRHEPFIGKVAILQQWLPGYRLPFFDMLAERCSRGVTVYAGESPTGDPPPVERLRVAKGVSCRNTRIFRGGRFELMLQRGVIEWLEASDPDVLVATPNPRMPHVLLAQRWMRRRGRPCLGWGLGTMAVTAGMPTGLRSLLRKPILRGFDGLICYSSRAAKEYEAAGFPTSRIAVARNATARRPDASPPTRTSIAGRPVRVLALGQLTPPKRIDLLIEAASQINRLQTTQLHLMVVGDGECRRSLEEQASRLQVRADFLGHLTGTGLRRALEQADLLVMPGMGGLAIQEAMAAALPVIVAEGDGTQVDLVRPTNGWNVRPNDVGALVAAIRDAVQDPTRLMRMGTESFRIVAEEINLDTMVDDYIIALRDLTTTTRQNNP
jgi:glycosyltransferase involved in cell wall biosynthesis